MDDDDDDDNQEEIPNWARKMQPPAHIVNAPIDSQMNVGKIHIKSNNAELNAIVHSSTVIIQNDERTWEKFHAKIMVLKEDGEFVTVPRNYMLDVKPKLGHLAPRGGASNACDANKPYSDSVTLHIFHRPVLRIETLTCGAEGGTSNELQCNNHWLVAGTEEEKFYFEIELE